MWDILVLLDEKAPGSAGEPAEPGLLGRLKGREVALITGQTVESNESYIDYSYNGLKRIYVNGIDTDIIGIQILHYRTSDMGDSVISGIIGILISIAKQYYPAPPSILPVLKLVIDDQIRVVYFCFPNVSSAMSLQHIVCLRLRVLWWLLPGEDLCCVLPRCQWEGQS